MKKDILDYRYGKIYKKDKKIIMYNNVFSSIYFLIQQKYTFVPIYSYPFLFSFRQPKKILYSLYLLDYLKNTYHARILTLGNKKTYFFCETPFSLEKTYDFYLFEKYIHKPTSNIIKKCAYLYYYTLLQCPTLKKEDLYLYVYLSTVHFNRDEILQKENVDIVQDFMGNYDSYFKLYVFLKEKGYLASFWQKIPSIETFLLQFNTKIKQYKMHPQKRKTFEKSITEIGDILEDMKRYISPKIDIEKIKRAYIKTVSKE
jgi:hypothetical protein